MRVQFKKILCATDFSDFSNHTVSYGVALAREFGSRLVICHIIDLSSVAIYGEFQLDPIGQQNRIIDDAQDQLEKLTGDQPVDWEPMITVGKPADEILKAVEEEEIDLAVAVGEEHPGHVRKTVGRVGPVLLEDVERLGLDRVGSIVVVHAVVVVIPHRQVGDGVEDRLQAVDVALAAVALAQDVRVGIVA